MFFIYFFYAVLKFYPIRILLFSFGEGINDIKCMFVKCKVTIRLVKAYEHSQDKISEYLWRLLATIPRVNTSESFILFHSFIFLSLSPFYFLSFSPIIIFFSSIIFLFIVHCFSLLLFHLPLSYSPFLPSTFFLLPFLSFPFFHLPSLPILLSFRASLSSSSSCWWCMLLPLSVARTY